MLLWTDAVRREDPLRATAQQLLIGTAIFLIPAIVELARDPVPASGLAAAAAAGVATGAGALAASFAMRAEQVSLVSPVISLEGTIAAAIAVVAGEEFVVGLAIGLGVAAAGTACAVLGPFEEGRAWRWTRGISWAFVAASLYGVGLWLVADAGTGIATTLLLQQGCGAVLLLALSDPRGTLRRPSRRVVVPSVLYSLGFVAYAIGARAESIAVAAVLAGQFAVVAVVLAHVVRGDRLGGRQYAGICLLTIGVAIVAATAPGV